VPTSTAHQPAQFGFETADSSCAPTIGMLSTYPPTQCGLATFSAALIQHLHRATGSLGVVRVVDDPVLGHDPDVVALGSGRSSCTAGTSHSWRAGRTPAARSSCWCTARPAAHRPGRG